MIIPPAGLIRQLVTGVCVSSWLARGMNVTHTTRVSQTVFGLQIEMAQQTSHSAAATAVARLAEAIPGD